jgi:hypothetical protein
MFIARAISQRPAQHNPQIDKPLSRRLKAEWSASVDALRSDIRACATGLADGIKAACAPVRAARSPLPPAYRAARGCITLASIPGPSSLSDLNSKSLI